MSQTIPSDLQEYLDAGGATCLLLKVVPVLPEYDAFGVTDLDKNVVFNDGGGALTYYASIGADLSAWQTKNSMDVDNAETTGLMPTYDLPVTEEAMRAGAYDGAQWIAYLYAWDGEGISHVLLRRGELGQLRILDGERWTTELLGLTHRLGKNVVRQATRSCGATFGSQPIGTGGGVEERFPCGKDTSAMWVEGAVTALSEDLRYVLDTDLAAAAGTYTPGLLKWLTGANAGRSYEIERHLADGVLSFTFPLAFDPEVGDEFEIRADCTKWTEGANGCKAHFSTEWVLHFRGRPHIPNGEQDRLNSPGASG